ncbi:MAG: hypothetical protein GC150_07470 [Rhizobiales bacterium]|nr:hypothetical protein [Hyphomicrobiales bacterium]
MSLLFRTSHAHRLPFGADGRVGPNRIPFEFYPTPPEATRALLSVERFEGSIWEPACGDGAIAKVLADEAGHDVVATDLVDHGFGVSGIDFLEERVPRARHIVTNPPYGSGLADAFAVKALHLTAATGGKVAFLVNLTSLCHQKRTRWYRAHPPARIWAVDNIVCWPDARHGYGEAPRYFRNHRYCWLVWDPIHTGPTRFDWLAGADFR